MRYTVITTNGRDIDFYHINGSNDTRQAWLNACEEFGDGNAACDGWHVIAIVTGQQEVHGSEILSD